MTDDVNPLDPLDLTGLEDGAASVPRITWLLETHLGMRYEDARWRDLLYAVELCAIGNDLRDIHIDYVRSKAAVVEAAEAYADALEAHRDQWGEAL